MTTLSHPTTGTPLPPLLTTTEAAELLGVHRDTVIDQCRAGLLPTMPRIGSAPHRIVTAKLLRQLGLHDDPVPGEKGRGDERVAELLEIRNALGELLARVDAVLAAPAVASLQIGEASRARGV